MIFINEKETACNRSFIWKDNASIMFHKVLYFVKLKKAFMDTLLSL